MTFMIGGAWESHERWLREGGEGAGRQCQQGCGRCRATAAVPRTLCGLASGLLLDLAFDGVTRTDLLRRLLRRRGRRRRWRCGLGLGGLVL
jgi:hypothetical protein